MQRRKPGSTGNGGRTNHFSSSSSSSAVNNKYVLPTTTLNPNNKITKPKQQKKRISTVTCLVQTIVFLMIATSVTLIYIAINKGGKGDAIGIISGSRGGEAGLADRNDGQQHPSHAPIKIKDDKVSQHNELKGEETSGGKTVLHEIVHPKDDDDNTTVEQHPKLDEQQDTAGDGQKNEVEQGDQDEGDEKQQDSNSGEEGMVPPKRKRTTAEANADMAKQPSFSVDGEKALKKKLYPLYELQTSRQEQLSPIITRWIGDKDKNDQELKYWLPKSTTSDEVLHAWKNSVETMKEEYRKKDVELFPHLHGLYDTKPAISEKIELQSEDEIVESSANKSVTEYPLPSPEGTHVVLKPTFGKHRENADAVFALAEGYDLKIYLLFIESLKATGFNGDLVLSVSALGSLKPGVEEYLRSNQIGANEEGVNVVAYTITWTCYDGQGEVVQGAKEGVRKCELVGMYGEDADEHIVSDTREPRPVATARFELYWAWSQYYQKENWIMLIDSRDAHFQLDPFSDLPRGVEDDKGLLYFFAENAQESNIGKSPFNSKWLKEAYGEEHVKSFFDKQIICSGSTMGQQIAMEPYLRAMVAQFDETRCGLKGCDQGFHNYLYYSNSLSNLTGVKEVKVYAQGTGIINNLGVLRSKPLREWGLLDDENNVLNWDKSISSVAHQFDRDDELNTHLKEVRKVYEDKFKSGKTNESSSTLTSNQHGEEQTDESKFDAPAPKGTHVILEPTFGKHRHHVDAIFGLAEGYDLRIYLLFIESLKNTGFEGDLVLSVSAIGSLKDGVEDYLRSYQVEEGEAGLNVVVYTVTWDCYNGDGTKANGASEGIKMCELVGMYGNDTDKEAIKDPREARPVATARFELYWAWSRYYDKHNWIMLIDTRDAHFQLNPFATLDHSDNDENKEDGLLYFFAENAEVGNIGKSTFNSRWLKQAYGIEVANSFSEKPIICSGSTMGQTIALEPYLRAMVAQFDTTKCKLKGCDQGFHNYLYYTKELDDVKGIREVVEFEQGKGIINNLGMLRSKPLRDWGILNEDNLVLNWDGEVSAVAHQFDRDDELNKHLKTVRTGYTQKFWASKKKN